MASALVAAGASAQPTSRIITLAPHLAELVCDVGRCDALVGVAKHSDMERLTSKPVQIGDAFNVNLESVLALRPTLVLAWTGGTPPQLIERLRALGIKVEMVQVQKLADVADALRQVGHAAGSVDQGERAAQAYLKHLQALQKNYRQRPRLRVFYQIETAPAFSINRNSPISEVLDLCGADNVFTDLPTLAAAVSMESVLAAQPQAVVFSVQDGADAIAAYWARLPELAPADPRFRLAVDGNTLTRQSPSVLRGVAEVCEGLERIRAQFKP
ncbi:MAG: helical backbone metal receptor [Pseudomonadota bacterium]|nr:helical backbone metal receptor [Pseudomonadota bacterium]